MIQLFDFQQKAAAQVAERFGRYYANRPVRGTNRRLIAIPFYQALASITGSGKTAILAEAVSQIHPQLPLKPIVLWVSRGRVVVSQTYANLQDGGKYRHLLGDFSIRLLSGYEPMELADDSRSILYFATVGTFNQKDKERGELLIFRAEIDTAEESVWEALKARENADRLRRPLIVVYDEAQNLSDQQTELLMDLEPDALLVASATMRIPSALSKVLDALRDEGWKDEDLTTQVSSSDVAESGLVKRDVIMGGYEAAMEKTIDDLLKDLKKARAAAQSMGTAIRPKAIYVCKTNIKETNSFQRDDPRRPFRQREAPPILIWRYLVEEQKVDPTSIAVYSNVTFDRNYPPPPEFVLFKGADSDYERFIEHPYEHIIFNLRLQEGWDDPECYFAYIDKSMGSRIQVEQIIGRVLRQPLARHYESDILNAAHFYVRVDKKGVFSDIVDAVRESLSDEGLEIRISSYVAGTKNRPKEMPVTKNRQVPHVYLDATAALKPVQKIIEQMTDYRGDSAGNTESQGSRALVQQRVGDGTQAQLKWIPYEHNNAVSARWLFQLEVSRQFPRALEVAGSDDPKFDARLELGSRAHDHIAKTANDVVDAYLQHVRLGERTHNPYVVNSITVDPSKLVRFKNALHDGYSGLNALELAFARALETTRLTWCRNPSRSGFPIPLLTRGQTRSFYPDFLVWRSTNVFAIDTTGQHLLAEKTSRKLFNISPGKSKQRLLVRLVSQGRWNERVEQLDKAGYTVWSLRQDRDLGYSHFDTISDSIKACIVVD